MVIVVGFFVILGALFAGVRSGNLPRYYWRLLLAGWAIGMVWELGFTFSHMGYPIHPGGAFNAEGQDITDLPLLAILPMLAVVSVWDGGLFLVGLVLARQLLGPDIEREFSWKALVVMLFWGQLQSLFIESYAITMGMWAYAPSAWNPALADCRQAQLTLLPQAVWFVGYFVFYAAVLKISRRGSAPEPPAAP